MFAPHPALRELGHRPWPPPGRPWRWSQRWLDLLFAHYAVPPAAVLPHLPAGLALDTRDGMAWVSAVPFRMASVRPRGLPPLPGVSYFPELNLRTYVTRDDRPGVYFLSIHAGTRLAAWLSRRLSALPYVHAPMCWQTCQGTFRFRASQRDSGERLLFRAEYQSRGPGFVAGKGTLDAWLVERYCLYVQMPDGSIHRGEVHHAPWFIQEAEAVIEAAPLGQPFGIDLARTPDRLHFSSGVQTVAWSFEPA